MQISDDLYLGPVATYMNSGAVAGAIGGAPSDTGFGPMGRVYVWDVVPLALNLSGLAVAQAVAGAGNLTLTAGTRVTSAADAFGTTRYILDVPRCVDFLSSDAGDTTQVATITGYDVYGQPMTQTVTLNGTTRAASLKAFKSITAVAINAACTGNISMGTTDVLGFPARLLSKDYVVGCNYNATAVALSASTIAVATSPATAATGDVRGTIALPTAADGAKRLVMALAMPAIAVGPNATRIGLLGVTQA